MANASIDSPIQPQLSSLPGDAVRRIMWRYDHRPDLIRLVESSRKVARGPVASIVSGGGRHTHEWTEEKAKLLPAYDEAGLTTMSLEKEYGGFIEGPKNLAMALAAFELNPT